MIDAIPTTGPGEVRRHLVDVRDRLRASYPTGVPPQDYIPLLAVLRRSLTDDEIREIAHEIGGLGIPDAAAPEPDPQPVPGVVQLARVGTDRASILRVQRRLLGLDGPLAAG